MYRNGQHQRRRVLRKLVEAAFDLEVARNFLQESDLAELDAWESIVMDCSEVEEQIKAARELAQDTITAMKAVPPPATNAAEQKPPTPVATVSPESHPGAKPVFPKDKQKGG